MATKPRHRKTETQLWVYDNAKRLGLTEDDLARATGVQPGTARSWFSRGKPNADAISILEKLFGRPAPRDEEPSGLGGDVAAAIRAQTDVLTQVLGELRLERVQRDVVQRQMAGVLGFLANAAGVRLPASLAGMPDEVELEDADDIPPDPVRA